MNIVRSEIAQLTKKSPDATLYPTQSEASGGLGYFCMRPLNFKKQSQIPGYTRPCNDLYECDVHGDITITIVFAKLGERQMSTEQTIWRLTS